MPIILVDGKPTQVDFVEYARDGKTFADREYEKWLKERDKQKENHNVVHDTYSKQPKQVGS